LPFKRGRSHGLFAICAIVNSDRYFMSVIRRIEIENFRVIANLDWRPSPGVNCLMAPGDSGKSMGTGAVDARGRYSPEEKA
jgi:hypothetical protein